MAPNRFKFTGALVITRGQSLLENTLERGDKPMRNQIRQVLVLVHLRRVRSQSRHYSSALSEVKEMFLRNLGPDLKLQAGDCHNANGVDHSHPCVRAVEPFDPNEGRTGVLGLLSAAIGAPREASA